MNDLPTVMTVIAIASPGGPEKLIPDTQPVPQPGHGELLVRIRAAGVNRAAILQRQGLYPPPDGASPILGLEFAGDVVAKGPGTSRFKIGDKVAALVAGGGYAQFCTVPEGQALPIPRGLDYVQAACLPETFFTVWTNVFERAQLKGDEAFLVHGGASGIGTTAIMLAEAFGARVFATCSSDKRVAVERLGAERAIDYRTEDFVAVLQGLTADRGVDVVLDMVGGDYFPRNLQVLAVEGRLVQIASLHGSKAEIDLILIMQKRLSVSGSGLRYRSIGDKAAIAAQLETKVWPLLESGRIRPVVDSTFPLENAAEAHKRLEAALHIGKVILTDAIAPNAI
jgi:NADPH2:quinone reductase